MWLKVYPDRGFFPPFFFFSVYRILRGTCAGTRAFTQGNSTRFYRGCIPHLLFIFKAMSLCYSAIMPQCAEQGIYVPGPQLWNLWLWAQECPWKSAPFPPAHRKVQLHCFNFGAKLVSANVLCKQGMYLSEMILAPLCLKAVKEVPLFCCQGGESSSVRINPEGQPEALESSKLRSAWAGRAALRRLTLELIGVLVCCYLYIKITLQKPS